jgi:hypothetical protein
MPTFASRRDSRLIWHEISKEKVLATKAAASLGFRVHSTTIKIPSHASLHQRRPNGFAPISCGDTAPRCEAMPRHNLNLVSRMSAWLNYKGLLHTMIMHIIRQTEDFLCEFRAQLATDLEEYESGRRTTGVLRNGLRYDDTQDRIGMLRRRLAKAEQLIATYDEYKGA